MAKIVQENNLFADWFYALLLKYPYNPQNKSTFWVVCIFGHLYKLLIESQKQKMGIFDDAKSEDPKLRKIFDEFLAPKILVETKEFSKEKNNMSEIIEMEDDAKEAQGESDEPTRKFTDTHFPTDFKVTMNDEVMRNLEDLGDGGAERKDREDDMVRIDKDDGAAAKDAKERTVADDLANWKDIMAYSNRQIEAFVGKKDDDKEEEKK